MKSLLIVLVLTFSFSGCSVVIPCSTGTKLEKAKCKAERAVKKQQQKLSDWLDQGEEFLD